MDQLNDADGNKDLDFTIAYTINHTYQRYINHHLMERLTSRKRIKLLTFLPTTQFGNIIN